MTVEWDGRYPRPFENLDEGEIRFWVGLRDTEGYTQEYRELCATHGGWNSWQEIMDAGLRDAKIPEPTHCPECGRPYDDGNK